MIDLNAIYVFSHSSYLLWFYQPIRIRVANDKIVVIILSMIGYKIINNYQQTNKNIHSQPLLIFFILAHIWSHCFNAYEFFFYQIKQLLINQAKSLTGYTVLFFRGTAPLRIAWVKNGEGKVSRYLYFTWVLIPAIKWLLPETYYLVLVT